MNCFPKHVTGINRRGARARIALTALALLWLSPVQPASAIEMSRAVAQLYADVSIYPPSATSMTVCYGFVCRRRATLDFSAADRATLTTIMATGKVSPTAERAAIQRVVVWFDRKMAPSLGTSKRVARADIRHRADAQNYDCWDTTRNVTSLLLILQELKLLRHHDVSDPRYRGNALFGQTPHNTAVIKERASKSEWVVDMWTRAFAQTPDVMTVEAWLPLN